MTDPAPHHETRKCSQCDEHKPLSEFGSGDSYRCLPCIRARVATWRLRRRQAQGGAAAGAEATARAKRAVCGRAAAGGGADPRAQEVRRELAEREQQARDLRLQLGELEPEREAAERRLALVEGRVRSLQGEADEVNRLIAELDRQLAEAGGEERRYVLTSALAALLEPAIERHGGIVAVAQRTGVDRRALRGILDIERPLTTLRLADLVCTRLGLDLSDLEVMARSEALAA